MSQPMTAGVPFGERRLLDAGCGNGKFLDICCRRCGAREDHCVGTDKRGDVRAVHCPGSSTELSSIDWCDLERGRRKRRLVLRLTTTS